MAKRRIQVDVLPGLRDILVGNCDLTPDPKDKKKLLNPPTGQVHLSAQHLAAFKKLCGQVKYKPEGEIVDTGNEAGVVSVSDLYGAISLAPGDTEVLVDAEVEE